MEALIQIRRGTAAQWTAANPILADGEPGLETDTGKGKYGKQGVHWLSLPYSWSSAGPTGPAGGSLAGTFPNPTLAANSVGATQITDASVGTAELANGAVTAAKLANGAVGNAQLGQSVVGLANLAPNSVDSTKIVDGSVVLADLDPAAVDSLTPDVADEGATVVANVGRINFVGAGVTAAAAGAGVATVTIPGGPVGTGIPAGAIAEWAGDPAAVPAGWFLCDGAVRASLSGTVGSRYGTTAGTVPNFVPQPVDFVTTTINQVVASTQAGWAVDSVWARVMSGLITVVIQVRRSGGDITSLSDPQHPDQSVCILTGNYIPENQVGGSAMNAVRMMRITPAGSLVLTAGVNDISFANANIRTGDVFVGEFSYPPIGSNTWPKTSRIIKDV